MAPPEDDSLMLTEARDLAQGELEQFLLRLSHPVLITGPLARAPLEVGTLSGVQGSPLPGQVVPVMRRGGLSGNVVWLGRGLQCDVILPFESVSRIHASLVHSKDDEWLLGDAQSRNGTFVGERRLEPGEMLAVHDCDRLIFGKLVAQFLFPESLYMYLRC